MASRNLAEVQKENEDLKVQIATLKKKLGLDDEKAEAQSIKQSFDLFDRDKDGFITKAEFELLAFECGTDVSVLTPENLDKVVSSISSQGKISFDEFQKWTKSAPAAQGKGANLGALKYKLQSKAWLAKVEALRVSVPKADAKDQKGAVVEKSDMKLFNLGLGLGQFQNAKTSITVNIGENKAGADAARTAVNCPADSKFFLYIDFGLKDGFDEAKVGELCGMIDTMLNGIPWQAIPLPIYKSHSVDVADLPNGKKALRLTVFSAFDPEELVAPFLSLSATPLKVSEVLSGVVKVEAPIDISDVVKPDFRLTPENMKARIQVTLDVNRKLKSVFQGMSGQPQFPKQVQLAALAFFVRGVDLNLTFAGLDDLLANIPDGGRNPASEMKAALSQLSEMPIGAQLPALLGMAAQAAEGAGQKALYDNVKSSLLGLSTVHVQLGDFIVSVNLSGLDVLSILP